MVHRTSMRLLALAAAAVLFTCCAGGPPTITVAADRNTAVANGTDRIFLNAVAKQADGRPLKGTIDFTATTNGRLSAERVPSDEGGVATTTLTATIAGPVTVTATSTEGGSGSATVTFTVPPVGPRLRFQTSPGNTVAQNLLRPVPVVVVESSSGVMDSTSDAVVTVVVADGSCNVALDSSSLMTVTANQGSASFFGLKISVAAQSCRLSATSPGIEPATSLPFNIQ